MDSIFVWKALKEIWRFKGQKLRMQLIIDPADITAANNQKLGVFVEDLTDHKVGTIAYYGRFGDID